MRHERTAEAPAEVRAPVDDQAELPRRTPGARWRVIPLQSVFLGMEARV